MPKVRRSAKHASRPLESDVMHAIRVALAGQHGVVLWRNNTGAIKDSRGIPVRYGLCEGSADLVGIVRTGYGPGRFFAFEVKRDQHEEPTKEQYAWGAVVNDAGGYWGWGWTIAQAEDAVRMCATGEPGECE